MAKFFNKIRYMLIRESSSSSKISKYLLYALGEIILVVIGILIALTINDNNAERKERVLEVRILKELKNNLDLDLIEIRDDILVMDSVNASCANLIAIIEKQDLISEALFLNAPLIRVSPHFDPNKSAYELLKSKGLEIIKNDSLRMAISVLYESNYSYYYRYEEERIQFRTNSTNPELLKFFTMIFRPDLAYRSEFRISQEDYEKLRKDPDFLRLVHAAAFENAVVRNRAQYIEGKILSLIDQIKNELDLKKI